MSATYIISDPQSNCFYQLPSSLLLPEYETLSPDAKLLYAIILDRTLLSSKNATIKGWETSRGVYCRCNKQMVMRLLSCGPQKATNLYRQLEEAGLLDIPDHVSGDLYLKKAIGMDTDNDDPYFRSKRPCRYQYLRIPKVLFTDYCNIPGAAKLIYTYLLNKCFDTEITIKQKDITDIFGIDPKSARKYFTQLCEIGLIEKNTKSQRKEKSPQPSSQGQEDTKNMHAHSKPLSAENQEAIIDELSIEAQKDDHEHEKQIWDHVFAQLGSYATLISDNGYEGLIINEIIHVMINTYTRQSGYYYINRRKRPIHYLHAILHRVTPLHIGCTLEAIMSNLTIGHYKNFPAYVRAVLVNSVIEDLPYRKPPIMYSSLPCSSHRKDFATNTCTAFTESYTPQNRPSHDMYERLLEKPACG